MGEYLVPGIKRVNFTFSEGLPLWDSNFAFCLFKEGITVKKLGQIVLYLLQSHAPREESYGHDIREIKEGKHYKFGYKILDKVCGEKVEYEGGYDIEISPMLITDFIDTNLLKTTQATSLTSEIPGIRAFAKKLNNA